MSYLDRLDEVARRDVEHLKKRDLEYGSSWKRRGGIGAFMMLARKWDRIENQLNRGGSPFDFLRAVFLDAEEKGHVVDWESIEESMAAYAPQYDILTAIEKDARPDGLIDDVRDLRRYLMLVEAELLDRGAVK